MTTIIHRFSHYQNQCRSTLFYINWSLIILGTIVGLLPLFLTCDEERNGIPNGYFANLLDNSTFTAPLDSSTVVSLLTDDYVRLLGTPEITQAEIVGPFLGMCLPALMDLIVELYVTFTTQSTTTNASSIIRLTVLERFCFILGVMCNAFNFFTPIDWNVMVIFMVRFEITTIGNILVMAPLITFLERTTNIFTPFFTTFILLLLSLGNVMVNFSYMIAHGTLLHLTIYHGAVIILIILYVLILSSCLWSFCWFLCNRQYTKIEIQEPKNTHHDPFHDFSVTHVPACHMVSLCVNVIIIMCFSFGKITPSVYLLLFALLLFASALVFVVEMRIRQNEVAIGLRQLDKQHYEAKLSEAEAISRASIANEEALRVLLEAKKTYVRYISHELRTPLNAATLGLNMVVTQLKKKRRMTQAEQELVETLSDIRLACSTAVDILNDLLSFEKLESGILVLHRENISVIKFMKEGIVMFSAQAKEKGVILDLVSTVDDATMKKYPHARPLRVHDEFSCDRFKMDQVLRNLVSNAIKFSPEGGKVTLQVFFDDTPPSFESNSSKKEAKTKTSSLVAVSRRSMRDSSYALNSARDDGDTITPQEDPDNTEHMDDTELFLMVSALQNNDEAQLGQLVIVVTDSGPGISVDNQQKLFRGVIQFDPEKNQGGGGSGFGLFISKGIVDLHKGTIAVFSEGEGYGCSFILTMPMVYSNVKPVPDITSSNLNTAVVTPDSAVSFSLSTRSKSVKSDFSLNDNHRNNLNKTVAVDWEDTMMPLTEQDQESTITGQNTTMDVDLSRKKYRLLIVDDSHLSRKMLCKTMRVAGHECDEAGDGLIALTKVKDKLSMGDGGNMYDAILMDTNMPNLDGPSAAKAMRDLGIIIPIFGVTGNGEEKDIEHYKSQGATAVFVKPFDMNKFVRHMKEIDFVKSKRHP